VTEPFIPGRILRFPLVAIAADRDVRIHQDALALVRPDDHLVETHGGAVLAYDALVLALGGRMTEGVRGALTFRGAQDVLRIAEVVDALRDGTIRRVAFVVPTGTAWALPIYELALQTAAAVRAVSPAAELTIVTSEPAPLAVFGAAAAELVAGMLAHHGVALWTAARAEEMAHGELLIDGERPLPVDRVIALPRVVGPRPRGVPCDPLGFVEVDEYARVLGLDDVYAVGDLASQGLKQGGLAAQQADVAAAVIAAAAGAVVETQPFAPTLRGLLVTGDPIQYLRHDGDGSSEVSEDPLWWPPGKIFARHLGPYIESHLNLGLTSQANAPRALQPL
jgi:sulfide:quinone oxidoreductase